MKKSIKKKWVEALLSKKYRQGRGALCEYDPTSKRTKYCCLGVLYDLVGDEWVRYKSIVDQKTEWGVKGFRKEGFLPRSFLKKVGISYSTQQKLTELNDDGTPFKVIANYIDKHL